MVTDLRLQWRHFLLRKAFFVFSVAVFLFLSVSYNVVFLSRVLPAVGKTSQVWPLRISVNVLLALALTSFFRAHLLDPGPIPERWHDFVDRCGKGINHFRSKEEWQPRKVTQCKRCNQTRPERAHHCSMCNRCVLRFDHHCPWIDNCVGFDNHKFFLLAVCYGFLACCVALATSAQDFWACIAATLAAAGVARTPGDAVASLAAWQESDLTPTDVLLFQLQCFLCLGLTSLLGFLTATHFWLATRNCTSVEGNYDNMPNPYHAGSSCANISQLFGAPGLDWLLPTLPCRPSCDGTCFFKPPAPSATRSGERGGDAEQGKASALFLVIGSETPRWDLLESEEIDDAWRKRYNVRSFSR